MSGSSARRSETPIPAWDLGKEALADEPVESAVSSFLLLLSESATVVVGCLHLVSWVWLIER